MSDSSGTPLILDSFSKRLFQRAIDFSPLVVVPKSGSSYLPKTLWIALLQVLGLFARGGYQDDTLTCFRLGFLSSEDIQCNCITCVLKLGRLQTGQVRGNHPARMGRANDSSLSIAKSRGLSVCVGLGSVGSSLGVQLEF